MAKSREEIQKEFDETLNKLKDVCTDVMEATKAEITAALMEIQENNDRTLGITKEKVEQAIEKVIVYTDKALEDSRKRAEDRIKQSKKS